MLDSPVIDLSKINEARPSREAISSDSEEEDEFFTTIKETSQEDNSESNVTFDQIQSLLSLKGLRISSEKPYSGNVQTPTNKKIDLNPINSPEAFNHIPRTASELK